MSRAHTLIAALTLGAALLIPAQAAAFCGFYVSGGNTKLVNNATQVVMMRQGTKTVLSMRNNYQGPAQDFAMVVPVPVVLKKEQVKTLSDDLFSKVDALGAPRLVQYWEQNPCPQTYRYPRGVDSVTDLMSAAPQRAMKNTASKPRPQVQVVAKFKRGEYDVVILSATESNALEAWLRQNKYNIPSGAAKVLKGYVQQGMYFFVAKVDINKVKVDKSGKTMLSPLRFHYDTQDFSLPVRLGLLNANGKQDLIVTILAKNQRYEAANAPNVTIPTNLIVDGAVKSSFGEFYAELFDYTLKENPGAVVTEYAWDATKCDPCPAGNFGGRNIGGPLGYQDLMALGLDTTIPQQPKHYQFYWNENAQTISGREPESMGHLRYLIRARTQACLWSALPKKREGVPQLSGNVSMQLTLDPKEHKATAKVVRESHNPARQGVASCVQESLNALDAGTIKALELEAPFSMQMTLSYSDREYIQNHNQWQLAQGWTMTRLHARYDSKDLKDDLVFKKVSPIIGGRGTPQGVDGKLAEEGSKPSSFNNFQGRYIILNRWAGKMACKQPRRGVWGYPPNGQAWQPKPAQDLAFAKRGKIKLARTIKSKDQPGLPWYKKR